MVLDGLGAHRTDKVRELVEAKGADPLFLPAYSPDLDPVEEAFSKIKSIVRKAQKPALAKRWSRRSAGRFGPSRSKTWRDGSPIADTTHRINTHEHRCS